MPYGTCESCGYEIDVTRRSHAGGGPEKSLCNLCHGAGVNETLNPNEITPADKYHLDQAKQEIQQTICYVGNAILEALKNR